MLSFAPLPAADGPEVELGKELADYVAWRQRRFRSSANNIVPTDCALHEVIPYTRIPRGVDLRRSLNDQLEPAGWHLQVHCGGRPRYYARAGLDGDWAIDWIGEAWLAEDIASGIQWLDEQEEALPDSNVQLLSSRLFRFSSFMLDAKDKQHALNGQHVVVSAPRYLRGRLRLLTWMTDDELARRLLSFYGSDYAAGGLRVVQ